MLVWKLSVILWYGLNNWTKTSQMLVQFICGVKAKPNLAWIQKRRCRCENDLEFSIYKCYCFKWLILLHINKETMLLWLSWCCYFPWYPSSVFTMNKLLMQYHVEQLQVKCNPDSHLLTSVFPSQRFWLKLMGSYKIQFECGNFAECFSSLLRQLWFTVSQPHLINGDCKWRCSSEVQTSSDWVRCSNKVAEFMNHVSGLFLFVFICFRIKVYPAALCEDAFTLYLMLCSVDVGSGAGWSLLLLQSLGLWLTYSVYMVNIL